jgi:hypothetical protein
MISFPSFETIRRYFRSRLKEYEDELAKLEDPPAVLSGLVESHPLLNSGVSLAIYAISCSNTFLNAGEIKDSDGSYMSLMNLEP